MKTLWAKCIELFEKYREIIIYFIAGCATTAVDWIASGLCYYVLHIGTAPSKAIAWVVAVIFGFVVNKIWVFESKSWKKDLWVPEAVKFVTGRIGTGIFEVFAMWVLVDIAKFPFAVMTIAVSIIVMVSNYLISKLLVFKNKESDTTK